MSFMDEYRFWREDSYFDQKTKDELAAIDYYSFDDMPTNYEDDYEE